MRFKNIYYYKFNVGRVIDGDTVYGTVDLGFNVNMYIKVRLYGINAPEMRGAEKEAGQAAKDGLIGMLLAKGIMDPDSIWRDDIFIETIKDKKGKYGRWLGILRVESIGKSINQWMVDDGFAVEKFY